MIALKVGQPEIANILIDAGANINARNVLGYKPLDFAIANNYANVAKKLVAAGATVSSTEFVELAKNSRDESIRTLPVSTVSTIKTPIINNATFNNCNRKEINNATVKNN
jgi:ankyrin repeat protein